jgi:tetratricopeptide (TPR) repeat protein
MPLIAAVCTVLLLAETGLGQGPARAPRPREAATPAISIDEGKRLLESGRYAQAITHFSAAIRRGANSAEVFKLRGKAFDKAGMPAKAMKDYSQSIELNPSDPEVHVLRGDAHVFNQDYDAGIEDYNKAIKISPRSIEAYLGRGLAHTGSEKYDAAIKDYHWVLNINPRNPEALLNMGRACMLAGRSPEAMSYLERALEVETSPKWKQKIQEWMEELLKDPGRTQEKPPHPTRGPGRSTPGSLW